jgi:hypothetical protein
MGRACRDGSRDLKHETYAMLPYFPTVLQGFGKGRGIFFATRNRNRTERNTKDAAAAPGADSWSMLEHFPDISELHQMRDSGRAGARATE